MDHLESIELPKGWAIVTIQDICKKITDGSHNPPKAKESGIPMLSAKNISKGKITFDGGRLISEEDFALEHKRTRITTGDVLITTVGTLGRTAIVGENCEKFALQRSVSVLGADQVDSHFLKLSLDNPDVQSFINMNAKGNAQKGFYIKQLKELQIRLAPLPEQKRIVEKLDSLLAQVETIQKRLNNLPDIIKRFRQSVLAAAVSGKLTEQWRSQNLEEEWQWLTIGDVSTVSTGSTPKRTEPTFWDSNDVPWLTSSVTGKEFCNSATQFVSNKAVKECRLKIFPPGTLLLAMYGEGKTRGQVTEISFEATCNQACAAILVNENKISKSFVKLRLLENYEATRMAAEGGNQPNLNLSKVRKITLPVPSIEEQTEIVRLVEQYFALADTLEKHLANAKARVDNLTQSILAKAFRGELVPQDPNDEPADKLLERIKAARQEAEKLEKAAKKATRVKR